MLGVAAHNITNDFKGNVGFVVMLDEQISTEELNALKQKWKDFIVYWINDLGLQDKKLDNFEMIFTTYMPTKRRIDCDNTVPKFILDGFSESGFIVDDDGQHLKSLTLKTGYDKDNPRTEIEVITHN